MEKIASEDAAPPEYASLENPLSSDDKAIAAGKALYQSHCAGCHGASGKGDGPKAAVLKDKPANLADPDMQRQMSDAFYFWRISEGIAKTPMPAYKGRVSEHDRWCLVCFVRTFGPDRSPTGANTP